MATVQELVAIGREIGLQGEALQSFVQEQQTLAREERTKEREHERQKVSLDEELERRKMEQEQRKLEQEMRMMEMRIKLEEVKKHGSVRSVSEAGERSEEETRDCARNLRSSDTALLAQPSIRTDFAGRAFCHSAPAVWNSLPRTVLESTSLTVFKSRLKTHLFHLAHNNGQ